MVSVYYTIDPQLYFTLENWLTPIEVVVLYLGASHLYESVFPIVLIVRPTHRTDGLLP